MKNQDLVAVIQREEDTYLENRKAGRGDYDVGYLDALRRVRELVQSAQGGTASALDIQQVPPPKTDKPTKKK